MKKQKYISPVASLSEACRLENRLCALSSTEVIMPGISFEKVTFLDQSKDKEDGGTWDSSWTED